MNFARSTVDVRTPDPTSNKLFHLSFLALLVLIAAVFLPHAGVAQSYVINQVQVEGNQRIEDATILNYLEISRGERVSAAELNDAFQRLQGSGLFSSVDIVPAGTTLMVTVTEFPTINRINIEGNQRLTDEVLLTLVQSQPRRVYSPSVAEADAAAITESYRQAGRITATVNPRIIPRSNNRVDLVFEVAEGQVVEVERISFVLGIMM